jgi:hypothetical protein
MKTRSDLVNEALTRLGALPSGQEPSAEDYAEVNSKVDPVVEDLAARNIAAVAPDAISEGEFLHVSAVLAYHSKGYFGVVGAEAENLRIVAQLAERHLKFYNRGSALSTSFERDYF